MYTIIKKKYIYNMSYQFFVFFVFLNDPVTILKILPTKEEYIAIQKYAVRANIPSFKDSVSF